MESSNLFINLPPKELKNKKISKTISFLNKMKEALNKKQMDYYGLSRKDNIIQYCCLHPKFSFESIKVANPYKLIFTSGSLPDK